MAITFKEKREIGLILGAVLVVAVTGLLVMQFTERRLEAIAGAAVELNPDIPTEAGVLALLAEHCAPVSGSGDCNSICADEGDQVCLPLDADCDISLQNNQCFCCSSP